MSVINSIPLIAAGDDGYQISRSVRLRSSASAYFNRTPASAGSQTTWTMSMWVKRGALGVRQFISMSGTNPNSSQVWQVEFDANNKLDFYNQTIGTYRRTTQVFRDSSAWYHIVFGADTNNATAQNRFRCWVNGVEVTAWDVNSTISSGYSFAYNGAYLHGIGAYTYSGNGLPLDGYLTEVNFIDGQALTPSSFGETDAVTGVWKPKKYAGTYGTNGFYLNFSDNSAATAAAIGKDSSGNGNNWTPNNISVTSGATYDSMIDVPTPYADGGNGRGNYGTMNPLAISGAPSITDGNLSFAATTTAYAGATGTQALAFPVYFEATLVAAQNGLANNAQRVGISNSATSASVGLTISCDNGSALSYAYQVNFGGNTSLSGTPANGDILMFAYDPSTGKTWAGVNGSWFASGNPSAGTNPLATLSITTMFAYALNYSSQPKTAFNFGQRPFAYTPPTGFKALNTQNLPDSTIKKGNQYFDATTYTGNGSTQSIVNAGGFQPDLVWNKARSNASTNSNILVNSVVGRAKIMSSNQTIAEQTSPSGYDLVSFDSSGFTVGPANQADMNTNGWTFVGWQWKKGATQGFDIVTYTGTGVARTVAHSLGVAPAMIITKQRNANTDAVHWCTYHASLGNTSRILLNTTDAAGTGTSSWNSTSPTSSVFSLGAGVPNTSGQTYVAYLFAEVAGFSKFGSYTGNGSADGPFVYCGFRPRWILVKSSTTAQDWKLIDTARNTYNSSNSLLGANISSAEDTNAAYDFDILSNGFKPRNTFGYANTSGATYIFAAFAEVPFSKALAR